MIVDFYSHLLSFLSGLLYYVLPVVFWCYDLVVRLVGGPLRGPEYRESGSHSYTFDGVEYMLPDGIPFPPYPDLTSKCKLFLAVECDDQDITELARRYAGPKDNFYHDLGHRITPDFFCGRRCTFLMADLSTKSFDQHEAIVL